MRVNPVPSTGHANIRRKRPSPEEARSERATEFSAQLPVAVEPDLEQAQQAFTKHYQPNSIFLAHLIATRDEDLTFRHRRPYEALNSANTYRETAALPRQRGVGHVLSTER